MRYTEAELARLREEVERLRLALTAIREEHADIPALVAFIDRNTKG